MAVTLALLLCHKSKRLVPKGASEPIICYIYIMYKEIRGLQTWKELRDFIDELDIHWIFRGQQNCKWSLTTGIDRLPLGICEYDKDTFKHQVANMMIDMLTRNLHNMPQYSSMLTSKIQKIAFLHHYGAPTQLL